MYELEMRKRKVNWLNLDEEILAEITDRIDCHHTLCKFRSVCKKWRSFSRFSSHRLYSTLPRQILSFDYRFKSIIGCEDRLKFLVGSVVYLIQPLNQNPNNSPIFWVVSLEELNPGLLRIRYPLTKSPIVNFPNNFPKLWNSANFRVSLIGKGLKFCFSNGDEGVFDLDRYDRRQESLIWNSFPTNTKVVLYLSNEHDFQYYFDHSFVVLVLDHGGVLGVLRRGKMYYLSDDDEARFDDIVNYKGKVCAIDRKGVAYLIDGCESRKMNVISRPICAGDARDCRKVLAESHGKLYMIVRECYKFRFYKLNEGQHMWEEVYSLDDRILFVTLDGCYFVEANDIVGCRGNCILFPKNCFPNYSNEYDDVLFKGASKFLEIGVFYLNEDRSRLISYYPGLSDMFWPPPSWLWLNKRSFTWPSEEDELQQVSPKQEYVPGKNCDNLIPSRDWSELPKELLKVIADHLTSCLDYSRFRAVCKKWHSSCHLSGPLLYSQLPHRVSTGCVHSDRSAFLVARNVYLLRPINKPITESSKPWLISVEDLNTGKLQFCHPLSKIPFKKLPMNFPKSLNFSEFQVSKLSFGFKICFSDGDEDVFSDDGFSKPWSDYPAPNKVILFSENATSMYDCVPVVLFLNQGGTLGSFILKTNQRGYLRSRENRCFDDIVKYKGHMCAVDSEGIAYLIDIKDGFDMRIVDVISERLPQQGSTFSYKHRRKLLVESFGELYIIVRDYWDIKVYKLSEKLGKWKKVDDLGDRILFVSFDNCFFVDAKDIPGCRGNCILFPKNCFPLHSGGYSPDYEFFNGEQNHLTIGVFYLDENRCKVISSYPSLSELFWPPPSWLCPDSQLFPCEAEDEHMDSTSTSESSSEDEEIATDESTWEPDDELFPKTRATVENLKSSSVVKFEGVDVRSDLVPYLKKILKMYDFMEGHAVRSNSLLTWAFESLAKMMIIIQNNRGKKKSLLDESQAEYLNSTLADLQSLSFTLGWMVPLVEKTLAL